MSRFRLRYGTTNLELFPGEFTVGRSSECNLALADNLVSRRHAVFRVGINDVVVEDLGSRNGIAVNGKRTQGASRVNHMDRVYVGAQELILIDSQRVSIAPRMGEGVICGECGAVNGRARRRCGECDALLASEAASTLEQSAGPSLMPHTWGGESETRTETTRDVIDGIAAKAVELGRFEEAERILRPHLDRLMERALRGEPLSRSEHQEPNTLLARATNNALELALGLQDCKWIDWVLEIYIATRRLMPLDTIEMLCAVARSQEYSRRAYIQTYLKIIREQIDEWSEAEQSCVYRLEELTEEIMAR